MRVTSGAIGKLVAIAALVAGLLALLAVTGPSPATEVSGSFHREGGVCLDLERWALLGWRSVGQTHSIGDTQQGVWHEPVLDPPCQDAPEQTYLVRFPRDAANGVYRICGLRDDNPCLEVRRVPFDPGPPGP